MLYRLKISTKGFTDIIDITPQITKIINKSKITNGIVNISSPGSTCGITSIEFEDGLLHDLKNFFEKIIPQNSYYKHNEKWHDGNGFSHIRSAIIKPFYTIPLINKKLTVGTWQQIIFIDFDNRPRKREIFVQILGE